MMCNPFPAEMTKILWRKSKSPQKYFGLRSGSVLFVHPVVDYDRRYDWAQYYAST